MSFWERVKVEIRNQRTTQEWLAEKIGMRRDSLSRWVSRGTIPDGVQTLAIASALGVSVEYLVNGADPKADQWLQEHRQLVEDLKALNASELVGIEAAAHALAEAKRNTHANGTGSA